MCKLSKNDEKEKRFFKKIYREQILVPGSSERSALKPEALKTLNETIYLGIGNQHVSTLIVIRNSCMPSATVLHNPLLLFKYFYYKITILQE